MVPTDTPSPSPHPQRLPPFDIYVCVWMLVPRVCVCVCAGRSGDVLDCSSVLLEDTVRTEPVKGQRSSPPSVFPPAPAPPTSHSVVTAGTCMRRVSFFNKQTNLCSVFGVCLLWSVSGELTTCSSDRGRSGLRPRLCVSGVWTDPLHVLLSSSADLLLLPP